MIDDRPKLPGNSEIARQLDVIAYRSASSWAAS
jgi:hypothetical protein